MDSNSITRLNPSTEISRKKGQMEFATVRIVINPESAVGDFQDSSPFGLVYRWIRNLY